MGVVTQDTKLFRGTIQENIALPKNGAIAGSAKNGAWFCCWRAIRCYRTSAASRLLCKLVPWLILQTSKNIR